MEGKVKFVRRDVWFIENQEYSNDSDMHARRCTATYAVLYNYDEVEIDEDDIRDYYDIRYLTAGVISALNESLHNVYIDYYEDEDGDYCLDGCLEDYI